MRTEQTRWSTERGWYSKAPKTLKSDAHLVLIFAGRKLLDDDILFNEIRTAFPEATLAGCSTSGEILDTEVTDDELTLTAITFDSTRVLQVTTEIKSASESFAAGVRLVQGLPHEGLAHLFLFSVGLNINGSELVKGALSAMPTGVTLTGGLAGDGADFKRTLTVSNSGCFNDRLVAVGLYGTALEVSYASLGGWDIFGPERIVTKSEGNILYELDGKSALALYKTYLGEHAQDLPASGLLFPLSIRSEKGGESLVRTILAVSEEDQSITFAGDIPKHSYAHMMQANFDRLVQGAIDAAQSTLANDHSEVELALLISCVGRKLVLKQRIEEEIEGVRDVLGAKACITGFYSYGEISPATPDGICELHNQAMTITTLSERRVK